MAQVIVMAPATTAATASFTVADGASVKVGVYVATGDFTLSGPVVEIWDDSPGADVPCFSLSMNDNVRVISGPGTFIAKRPALSQAIGVYTN